MYMCRQPLVTLQKKSRTIAKKELYLHLNHPCSGQLCLPECVYLSIYIYLHTDVYIYICVYIYPGSPTRIFYGLAPFLWVGFRTNA